MGGRRRLLDLGGRGGREIGPPEQLRPEGGEVLLGTGAKLGLELDPAIVAARRAGHLDLVEAQLDDARSDRDVALDPALANDGEGLEGIRAGRVEETLPGLARRPGAGVVAVAGIALELEAAVDGAFATAAEGLEGESPRSRPGSDPGDQASRPERAPRRVEVAVLDLKAPRWAEWGNARKPRGRIQDESLDRG